MNHLIITISRKFGSGGRKIGEYVAQKLSIPFYDRSKIDIIAQERGLAEQYIKNWQGQAPTSIEWNYQPASHESFYFNEKRMFQIQKDIICEAAAKGSCVIVGRCADFILRDKADCLKIMIYADKCSKSSRLYDEYWIRNGNLSKKLADTDKARAAYYKWFTGQQWGIPANYDLLLKSNTFGLEGCAEIITTAVQNKTKTI